MVETHPVQVKRTRHVESRCPKAVTLKAYEVYKYLYGEREELIKGDCRGGFGVNEIIAFLYASSFPKNEWSQRVQEALIGMTGI